MKKVVERIIDVCDVCEQGGIDHYVRTCKMCKAELCEEHFNQFFDDSEMKWISWFDIPQACGNCWKDHEIGELYSVIEELDSDEEKRIREHHIKRREIKDKLNQILGIEEEEEGHENG